MHANEFEGLAQDYEKFRPSYPDRQFERIKEFVNEGIPNSVKLLIDIGSGTGISTRLLRRYFDKRNAIIGIEPGIDMLEKAVSHSDNENICYMQGNSSSTCFKDNAIDFILVAQAVQWFDRSVFYKEAARILKSGAVLAVVQNNRDWQSSLFLSEYENFIETYGKDYTRYYRSFDIEQEINDSRKFVAVYKYVENWERTMSKLEFIGMASSSTKYKSAVELHGLNFVEDKLTALINRHVNEDGNLLVKYSCELYLTRKNEVPQP